MLAPGAPACDHPLRGRRDLRHAEELTSGPPSAGDRGRSQVPATHHAVAGSAKQPGVGENEDDEQDRAADGDESLQPRGEARHRVLEAGSGPDRDVAVGPGRSSAASTQRSRAPRLPVSRKDAAGAAKC